jgi:hypothetical protein
LIAEELLLSSGLEPRRFKTDFRHLNRFLNENMGLGHHVEGAVGACQVVFGVSWGEISKEITGNAKGWAAENPRATANCGQR